MKEKEAKKIKAAGPPAKLAGYLKGDKERSGRLSGYLKRDKETSAKLREAIMRSKKVPGKLLGPRQEAFFVLAVSLYLFIRS